MELVPVVHSYIGPLLFQVDDDDGRAPINVQIVMNKVHIAGLHASLALQLSQSYIQLRQVEIIHNFLIQHTHFNAYGYIFRFEGLMTNVGREIPPLNQLK